MGGVPILSIDYSLTVPFEVSTQELLDVYLWVFSNGNDVKNLLGFHPDQIVLSGDSAGGLKILSLAISINELNKMQQQVPRPKSIVATYPASTIGLSSLSKSMLLFEPLIQFHLYLIIAAKIATNFSTLGEFKIVEKSKRVFITFCFFNLFFNFFMYKR